MNNKTKKKYLFLGLLQVIIAICFILSAIEMESYPNGYFLNISRNLISEPSFIKIFMPGLFIFLFLGIGNFISSFLSFERFKFSSFLGIFFGIVIIACTILQIVFYGSNYLFHPIYIILGFIEVILGYKLYNLKKKNQLNYYR